MITKTLEEFVTHLKQDQPILAMDYGTKKSGVAISTPNWKIAMPILMIVSNNHKEIIQKIINIINEKKVCGFVIGLPLGRDREITEQTKLVLSFARKVEKKSQVPIFMQDERYTSEMANDFLKMFHVKHSKREQLDDLVAASMILEMVLNKIN